jgi:hypothetical protein
MKKEMDLVFSKFKLRNQEKGLASKSKKQILKFAFALTLFTFIGCAPDTRDLTGTLDRQIWFHPQPFGTVYIPSGTFHTGQSDQDVFQSFITPNKQSLHS